MTRQPSTQIGLSRQARCDRLAMEFQDGWVVNLGFGMPTLCANYDLSDREVVFQAENGVIGYGPLAAEGEEDLHLNNASGEYTTLLPGAAITDQSDSFAMIRAGYIDVVVLGAYEVAENGDFANWKTAGRTGGGIGGAMDLAVGGQTSVHRHGPHDARRPAPAADPLQPADHHARRGQPGLHQPGPVRGHTDGFLAGDRFTPEYVQCRRQRS